MAARYRWHIYKQTVADQTLSMQKDLGGRCTTCGSCDNLEFHHIEERKWNRRAVSPMQRIKLYRQDIAAGILCLLCKSCHRDPAKHPSNCACLICVDSKPDF